MSIRKRIKPITGSHTINKNIDNQINKNDTNNNNNNNNNNKENIGNNSIIINNKNKRKFEEVNSGVIVTKRQMLSDMLNGYRTDQRSGDHHHVQESPVATLSNMGNTCWLNSVLYTLRFAPTFLHNLHHLIGDLQLVNQRLNQNKIKTSSLGRNIGQLTGTSTSTSSSSRSTSSKDLLSLTTTTTTTDNLIKSKYQIVTEKLHELYCIMHQIEIKDTNEPYQPDALLQAIRDANSIFDGNHQQDAHELLVYLLDNLRETCDLLQQQVQHNPDLLNDNHDVNNTTTTLINSKLWNVNRSKKKLQKKKDNKNVINEEQHDNTTNITDTDDTCSIDSSNSEKQHNKNIYNFIMDDFQGITLRRTKCLECESITERKEPFYDIPVPIQINDNDDIDDDNDDNLDINQKTSDIFRKACVLSEKLNDTNKYLCEQCTHYNEAIRDVLFEKLPNIMVLQLKRFTTTINGIKKINKYLPTPLELECFCETCCKFIINNNKQLSPPHHYQLYCVIMHLGGTMASGHYISYIKATSNYLNNYLNCNRFLIQQQKNNCLSSSSSEKSLNFLKYFKPKQFTNTLIDCSKNLTTSSSTTTTTNNGVRVCKSIDCCGIKLNRNVIENTINSFNRSTTTTKNDMWLECDDENVRPITTRELQEELSFKPNSTSTPYLLFYSKITETNTID